MKSSTGSTYDFRSQDVVAKQLQPNRPSAAPSTPDANAPIGTTKSNYAPPSEGPFLCSNCEHYTEQNEAQGACDHPDVVADAEAGEIPPTEGGALVEGEGCCTYYRPVTNG